MYIVTLTTYTHIDSHQHEETDIYEVPDIKQAVNLFCNLVRPLILKLDQPYTVVTIDYNGECIANFQST